MSQFNFNDLLSKIKSLQGNGECADCSSAEPGYISSLFGVVVCFTCGDIHKELISNGTIGLNECALKLITDQELELLLNQSNHSFNLIFERFIPPYLKKPSACSDKLFKEEWIRAKYLDKQFTEDDPERQISGHLTLHLADYFWTNDEFSNGKEYIKRYFILDSGVFTLKYHIDWNTSKEPKFVIPLRNTILELAKDTVLDIYVLRINFLYEGKQKNMFIHSKTSNKIYYWFTNIQCLRWKVFQSQYNHIDPDLLAQYFPCGYIKSGWLYKTGGSKLARTLNRWFLLDLKRLTYYEKKRDLSPKGEILLNENIKAPDMVVHHPRVKDALKYSFILVSKDRIYEFFTVSEENCQNWIDEIAMVLTTNNRRLEELGTEK